MTAQQKGLIDFFSIAKVCHEANRALCAGIGDNSQLPWEDAPQWQRDSAVNGVRFNLENPDAPASASHDSWLEEKRLAGWKFGPVKDADMKEHPCYVSFEMLPPEQKAKDHLFKAVCGALSSLDSDKPDEIGNYHPVDGIEYGEMGAVRKMTRSQQRYRDYQRAADCYENFHHYLKCKEEERRYNL